MDEVVSTLEPMHEVGEAKVRVDALDKVTGRAKYTDDLCPKPCLVARIVHASIANGRVLSIDAEPARSLPGVVAVFTCFDVPDFLFPTPGHPWSVDAAHQDVADRRLLDDRVRIYGDDIAVVVADDEVAAQRAVRLVASRVVYEELPFALTHDEAMSAPALHPDVSPTNVLAHHTDVTPVAKGAAYPSVEEALRAPDLEHISIHVQTQQVNHVHIETNVCFAYMEGARVTVVSSTQIPHVVRRVCGQALGIGWGNVRVIKPYVGGGFGNKQEVLYEPLCAWLAMRLPGRTVKIELPREEVFQNTRSRHPMAFDVEAAYSKDGRLMARSCVATSNTGGYASHGHALIACAITAFRLPYVDAVGCRADATTYYSNIPSPGAMRAYGSPQGAFAVECLMDDIAVREGFDPVEFRLKNLLDVGFVDPMSGIEVYNSGLRDCIVTGAKRIGWTELKRRWAHEQGTVRHGVGMSSLVYKSNVWPISLETASIRLVLNQDATCQLQSGATEIGQGADTVFAQMAAETIGVPTSWVHAVSAQDTDVSPFDTGAYASRQTYVTGHAIKMASEKFRARILTYAAELLEARGLAVDASSLDIRGGVVVDAAGSRVLALDDLAQEAFYSFRHSVHITAEETAQVKSNTFSYGAGFAAVEVDLALGKVKILDIVNVHDCGRVINPVTAAGQVHGGMAQGIGAALTEEMLLDPTTGKLRNPNLLDYKIPTAMDVPDLSTVFVEGYDPTGPYGNKALGEPPLIAPIAAIRNAILDATGVALYELPMTQQRLVEAFGKAGLI